MFDRQRSSRVLRPKKGLSSRLPGSKKGFAASVPKPKVGEARLRLKPRRRSRHSKLPVQSHHFLDRMVSNIEHGRFERSLSALTAAGALVTGAEIFLEHDSASFGNRVMWLPIAITPIGMAAGVAGFFSKKQAKTFLPIASAMIVINGLQGTYLHARGISQKPGGWRLARYNIEMGPPLFAPLLFTVVGGMGLLASVLRREEF